MPTLAVNGKDSGTARIFGSGTSGTSGLYTVKRGTLLTNNCLRASLGVAELLIFHPVDTIAKRLMSNKAKVSKFLLFYTNVYDPNT